MLKLYQEHLYGYSQRVVVMILEVMEAAREAASDSQPHVLTADEVASATAPVVDNARFIDEALQDAIPPEMR